MSEDKQEDKMALPDAPVTVGSLIPTKDENAWILGLVRTNLSAGILPGNTTWAQALSIAYTARDMGIPVSTGLAHMHIIHGRIGMDSLLMLARIRRSGKYGYCFVESDKERATLRMWPYGHKEEETFEITFTIEDAREKQLVKSQSAWEKWPEDLLRAKVIARCARVVAPDVVNLYATEELQHMWATVEEEEAILPVGKPPRVVSIEEAPDEPPPAYRMAEGDENRVRAMMRQLDYPPEVIDEHFAAFTNEDEANQFVNGIVGEWQAQCGDDAALTPEGTQPGAKEKLFDEEGDPR